MKTMLFWCVCIMLTVSQFAVAQVSVVGTYDYRNSIEEGHTMVCDTCPVYYLSAEISNHQCLTTEKESFTDLLTTLHKHNHLLIYVHGDGANFDELVQNESLLAEEYDLDMLLFTWPSADKPDRSRKNYLLSKYNSSIVFHYFTQMMDSLYSYLKYNDLTCTLMFNSLGNLFARQYAHYLINNPQSVKYIDNIILNAACVWEMNHNIWVDVLANQVKNSIFVTRNENDYVLLAATEFIENGDLLGKAKLQDTSEKAIYIDVTEILKKDQTPASSHGYFMGDIIKQQPNLKQFYQSIFYNTFQTNIPTISNQLDTNYYILTQKETK